MNLSATSIRPPLRLKRDLLFTLTLGLIYVGCTSETSSMSQVSEGNQTQTDQLVEDVGPSAESDDSLPDMIMYPTDPFEVVIHDYTPILSYGEEHFQNAFGDFDLGPGPFASVTLIVDLHTSCYPFEKWQDDPPPEGHNWPPKCDAFDRNFEITLDPPQSENDPPAFEVMRAITPFGGPSHHEIDLTDFANARPGTHRTQTHITTWSDGAGQVSGSQGGWEVSVKLKVVPGDAPRPVLAVLPLMNTSVGASSELPNALFNVPEGVVQTRLEYRVTGHGGAEDSSGACIGPAEEFCQRTHVVYVDGTRFEQFTPWRDDCDQLCTLSTQDNGSSSFEYCLENPTGSIASVRASRANWCPGALTPPFTWDIEQYKEPGRHAFRFDVLNQAEGGSWRVSAHLYLYGADSK